MTKRFIPRLLTIAVLFGFLSGTAIFPIDAAAQVTSARLQPQTRVEKRVLHIKFTSDSGVRVQDGSFMGSNGRQIAELNDILNDAKRIRADKLQQPQLGGDEAIVTNGLKQYYKVRLARDADVDSIIARLKTLPIIEEAYAQPKPAPSPSANYDGLQNYLKAAPTGLDRTAATGYPGGTGAKTRIVDIEYSWNTAHEDLAKARPTVVNNGTPVDPYNNNDHGTAVLGAIAGDANQIGVTGLSNDAKLYLVNSFNQERNWDIPTALAIAAYITRPGDIILIEQESWGPNNSLVPVEWIPEIYDAIKSLTAGGRIVIEPAANSNQNLDDKTLFGNTFPAGKPNSGAIIVGAGEACSGTFRSRYYSSNFGRRVNVQGPGNCVVTAGYGDLYYGGPNAAYTSTFNSTSSASAVIAAAAASLSSTHISLNGTALSPAAVIYILAVTGTPQDTTSSSGNIGPQPNLAKALPVTDKKAPSAPTNPRVTLNTNKKPVFTWTAATDNVKVTSYRVFRDNVLYKTINTPTVKFTDTVVTKGKTYSYKVQAVDGANHLSVFSPTVSIIVK